MGCNSSKIVEPEAPHCFRAAFSGDLKQLFDYYLQVACFIRDSLSAAIDHYL
jgi:hypothetical protein